MILHIPWMPFLDDAQRWTFFTLLHDFYIPLLLSIALPFQLVEYLLLLFLVRRGFLFLVTYDGWLLKPTRSFGWTRENSVSVFIRQSLLLRSFKISDRSLIDYRALSHHSSSL